jgi:hypothetical protein
MTKTEGIDTICNVGYDGYGTAADLISLLTRQFMDDITCALALSKITYLFTYSMEQSPS